MHSFAANAHAKVKHILSNTFVKVYRNCLPEQKEKCFYSMGQFFLCSTFHKRSSGKLIRERATANLDRALRELNIYLLFIFKQTRPTTHHPIPAHARPTHPPTRFSQSRLWGPLNYPRLNVDMTWSYFQRNFLHVFSEFLWRRAHS